MRSLSARDAVARPYPFRLMPQLKFFLSALLGLGVAVSAPASAQERGEATGGPIQQALHPGDVIRLQIWREPDLSGDFPVDQRGIVTFPKLGPMSVSAESTETLRTKLVGAYQEYLRNPSIEVTLLRRVNILGAVKTPGLYPVDPTMTIADAVALAGGATPDGNRRQIELLRGSDRIVVQLTDAVRLTDLPLRSGDQIFVPERSWISRNPGVLAASVTAAASLIIAVFIR